MADAGRENLRVSASRGNRVAPLQRGVCESRQQPSRQHGGTEEDNRQDGELGGQEEPMVLRLERIEAPQPARQLLARGICPTDDERRLVWRHRKRLPAFLGRHLARIQALFLRLRLHPMGQ